ncbi:Rmf/CrpP fold protein [Streptomyces litchfieldiae]|uniref:Rmf/CrpP fold protein n=1 Tax=Streptomyces litchfieldiae TaxID=3075543 RepID=A0ABU2MYN2_9ACTN|nr:Rmf/CrpP fold protein [Streptomyces sp. DSM 44938]MDT0346766.1 Rmf/CrpP fold protein [Streptomyces sp. DSM 44938]
MGPREPLVRALAEGNVAGREDRAAGQPPRPACPYPRGDLRRAAWTRGYIKANPPTIHDDGMPPATTAQKLPNPTP